MKIKIEPGGHLTPEELEEIKDGAKEASDEEFAEQMEGVTTVVITEAVLEQMKAMGIDPDEMVAMMLKKAKKIN